MSPSIDEILSMSAEKRHAYAITQISVNKKVWILTDEHGCVMLNTEDEDCVPVWPAEEYAESWATGDWSHCKPQSISLQDWFARWTHGLEGDNVSVAVFPNPDEDGVVIFPDVFEAEIRKKSPSH